MKRTILCRRTVKRKGKRMEFKQVLEYFVAHIEYVVSGEQAGSRGYDKYIAPWNSQY